MSNTLFSIIIPTYNRADFIHKTINSAIAQTYTDFEIIVVDDGSTDNTQEIVEKIKDKRIHYYKKENAERGAARNYGIKKANGNYITFLDSDDLLYPNYLEEAHNFIELQSDISFFFQSYDTITPHGVVISNSNKYRKNIHEELITKGNFIACQGVFIKRDIMLSNLFHENRTLAGSEDYELWLRLWRQGKKFNRKLLMIKLLFEDNIVSEKLTPYKRIISSNAYSYISLHLAMTNYKKDSFNYLIKSIKASPAFILKKRFFAIVKHLLF